MVRSLLFIFLLVSPGISARGEDLQALERLETRVRALTAPELAGRGSGTAATVATADLLVAWMQEAGLVPGFADVWLQEFPLTGQGWLGDALEGLTSVNVAGLIPGRGALAGRYLIIGAHHDHLGLLAAADPVGEPAAGQYYPGANDNASGVAVVLETLRQLAQDTDSESRRGLLFVFFGAEEVGLQGSAYFVNHSPLPLDRVDLMVNFDTVGQLTDNKLYVSGVGTAASLPGLVAAANTEGFDLSLAQGGWSGSDHMSFNTREVPVLFVFGGPYLQYNTPRDTWDTLDYTGLQAVARFGTRLIADAASRPGTTAWVMVAEPDLRQDDGSQNRSSWLGTLPDFTEEIQGYKLAGVFDGSPAARAGLIKGDVLVTLAGHPVVDLPTFTRALRANDPGDLVEITVLREGRSLNFTVVLGDRKDRK